MFTADGMPIPCNDKSMLLSTLEEHVSAAESSYIIIDDRAIVNKIQNSRSV